MMSLVLLLTTALCWLMCPAHGSDEDTWEAELFITPSEFDALVYHSTDNAVCYAYDAVVECAPADDADGATLALTAPEDIFGLAYLASFDVWLATTVKNIREYDPDTNQFTIIAGGAHSGNSDHATGTSAGLNAPGRLLPTADDQTVYFSQGHNVRALTYIAPYAVTSISGGMGGNCEEGLVPGFRVVTAISFWSSDESSLIGSDGACAMMFQIDVDTGYGTRWACNGDFTAGTGPQLTTGCGFINAMAANHEEDKVYYAPAGHGTSYMVHEGTISPFVELDTIAAGAAGSRIIFGADWNTLWVLTDQGLGKLTRQVPPSPPPPPPPPPSPSPPPPPPPPSPSSPTSDEMSTDENPAAIGGAARSDVSETDHLVLIISLCVACVVLALLICVLCLMVCLTFSRRREDAKSNSNTLFVNNECDQHPAVEVL